MDGNLAFASDQERSSCLDIFHNFLTVSVLCVHVTYIFISIFYNSHNLKLHNIFFIDIMFCIFAGNRFLVVFNDFILRGRL